MNKKELENELNMYKNQFRLIRVYYNIVLKWLVDSFDNSHCLSDCEEFDSEPQTLKCMMCHHRSAVIEAEQNKDSIFNDGTEESLQVLKLVESFCEYKSKCNEERS